MGPNSGVKPDKFIKIYFPEKARLKMAEYIIETDEFWHGYYEALKDLGYVPLEKRGGGEGDDAR